VACCWSDSTATVPCTGRPTARCATRSSPAVCVRANGGRRIVERIAPSRATWSLPRESLPYDFRYGEPAYADLPLAAWARLLGRRARRLSVRRLAYQPPGGAEELRDALAGYLSRARGVVCAPEQILIVHGSQQAIDLTTRLLVDAGDRVVIEEPHYTGFSFCLTAVGAEVVHVPVDEHGLRVERLDGIAQARLACVTPSHRGRLRRRVPLREPPARVPAGARPARAGALLRHRVEGALSSATRRSSSSRSPI